MRNLSGHYSKYQGLLCKTLLNAQTNKHFLSKNYFLLMNRQKRLKTKALTKQLKTLKDMGLCWSYKKCIFVMYAGISLFSVSMADPSYFGKKVSNYFSVEVGSTEIDSKRNNQLFFYCTALSI